MTMNWSDGIASRVAAEVKRLREAEQPKLSVAKLSERTVECGYAMSRSVISDFELGRKKSLDVVELIALALALNVPPVALLYPRLPDGEVEAFPGVEVTSIIATQWFTGELTRYETAAAADVQTFTRHDDEVGRERIQSSRRLARLRAQRGRILLEEVYARSRPELEASQQERERLATARASIDAELAELVAWMKDKGWPVIDHG